MGSSRSRRRARAPLAVHLTSKGAEMLVKAEAYYDGKFWCARGIGADFFTQGRTLDELLRNAKEAAGLHFAGSRPRGKALTLLLLSETEVPRGKTAAG